MAHPNFHSMIPWYTLKAHLEQKLAQTDKMLRRATEVDAPVLRGRAVLLEELLNLPETLETLAQEDERAERENNG